MSIPNSLTIPSTHPSPLATESSFSQSASLFLFYTYVHLDHFFLESAYKGHHAIFQVLGDGEGQGSLVCCSPWGRKELDMTEQLKNKKMQYFSFSVELRDLVYHTTCLFKL